MLEEKQRCCKAWADFINVNEIKNSLENPVKSGNIFGKTDQCSKRRFHVFPGLRFYKNNFHVQIFGQSAAIKELEHTRF